MFVQPLANSGEGVVCTLNIAKLVHARLGVYRINARNSVGASEENVVVRRRDRTSDSRRDSSAVSSRNGYSNGGYAGKTNRPICTGSSIKQVGRRPGAAETYGLPDDY